MENRVRELALFNLGIDSKLRGCDLVGIKVRDICHGDQVASRAVVMQHKTERPVQFEITPATREAVQKWIKHAGLKSDDFVFQSRIHDSPHLGTRQYARILEGWVEGNFDLPTYEESACRSAAARAFQVGIDGAVSRHRGGRRTGDLRAD
jgi:site-specific recombinase XerC